MYAKLSKKFFEIENLFAFNLKHRWRVQFVDTFVELVRNVLVSPVGSQSGTGGEELGMPMYKWKV